MLLWCPILLMTNGCRISIQHLFLLRLQSKWLMLNVEWTHWCLPVRQLGVVCMQCLQVLLDPTDNPGHCHWAGPQAGAMEACPKGNQGSSPTDGGRTCCLLNVHMCLLCTRGLTYVISFYSHKFCENDINIFFYRWEAGVCSMILPSTVLLGR